MKWLVMLCVMAVKTLPLAAAQGSGAGSDDVGERPRVLCGRVLADARLLYCFSSQAQKKRSAESPLIVSLYPWRHSAVWPWLAQQYRLQQQQQALALRGKRGDPGIVDECCLKACYISELLNYC